MKINRKLENSTTAPAVHKSPELMATKFVVGDDVGGTNPCAKFHYDPIRGFCSPPRFAPARTGAYSDSASLLGFCRGRTEKPPAPFSRSIRQMTSFRDILAMCCKVISSFVIFAVLDLRVRSKLKAL